MTGAPHPLRCEPRTEVRLFAEAMERTLRKHDHKGGWDEMSLGDILERIRGELEEAEKVWNAVKTREDYEQVSKELIDVANFCMMFYDNLHPELYHTPHTTTTSAEKVPVYSYSIHLPLKNIPHIIRRKLALNDIGEDEDDFTRLGFELNDGDVIQVLRQKQEREGK